jgi:hypothetical protein
VPARGHLVEHGLAVMEEVIIERSWRHKQMYRLKRKLGRAKIEI